MKQAQQTSAPTITAPTYFGALRIKKVVGPPGGPNTTTTYICSGTRPIVEYVNGQLSKEYIYAGSALVATIAGSATTYHHPDHLSNRVETDATGAPVRTFGQLPYGEVWYEPTGTDKLKFTPYERDSALGETGLDYAMFLYYSPGLGRFMSADLLAGDLTLPQSLPRVAYVLNDPVNRKDSLGLENDCGGPCVPFSFVLGNCMITVSYYTVSQEEPVDPDDPSKGTHKVLYDMPEFSGFCAGEGPGAPGAPPPGGGSGPGRDSKNPPKNQNPGDILDECEARADNSTKFRYTPEDVTIAGTSAVISALVPGSKLLNVLRGVGISQVTRWNVKATEWDEIVNACQAEHGLMVPTTSAAFF